MAIKTYVNEVDGFYILGNKDKTLDELSRTLKIKKDLVKKYIDENTDTTTTIPIKVESVDKSLVQKRDGAVIMTQADSEKSEKIKGKSLLTASHIFKIRQDG